MGSTSRVPAMLTYLLAAFRSAATIGQASPPVRVLDGPEVTGEPTGLALWVGTDDPEETDTGQQAADMEQEWAALGARARDELFTIYCVADGMTGEDTMAAARDAAFGIVAAVENLLRADVNLGGNCLFAGVCPTGLFQKSTDRGALARVPFKIEGKARI